MSEQVNATPSAPVEESASQENNESLENNEVSVENQEDSSVKASSDDKATKEEKKEQAKVAKKIKQLKLKIDGKEFDEELPFEVDENDKNTLDYLTKQLQLAKMGHKRASEASDYKKRLDQVGEYLSQAKGNPAKIRELMKDLEVDEKQLAAMIVEEELERAKKSPEQLEKEKLERELQKIKEERDKEKQELEQQKYDLSVQKYKEKFQMGFDKGLQTAGLPDNDFTRKRVVAYMQDALDKGYDVEIEDVVPFVKQEMFGDLKNMFSVMPEEVLEEILGDNLKRLRKRNLEKAKNTPAVPLNKAIVDTGTKGDSNKQEERVSFKDFFSKL